jgi:5'(3')-deoxyribonucleotidase
VKTKIVLLDMDGVLANFVQAMIDTHGWDLRHDQYESWAFHQSLGMSDEQFWQPTEEPGWWLNIKPYPWAKEVVEMCGRVGKVVFCTSPSAHAACASEKVQWLRDHGLMGLREVRYQIGCHKELFAASGAVLIDDFDRNIAAFRQAGGLSITFPQPWNRMRNVDRLSHLADQLKSVMDWL